MFVKILCFALVAVALGQARAQSESEGFNPLALIGRVVQGARENIGRVISLGSQPTPEVPESSAGAGVYQFYGTPKSRMMAPSAALMESWENRATTPSGAGVHRFNGTPKSRMMAPSAALAESWERRNAAESGPAGTQ